MKRILYIIVCISGIFSMLTSCDKGLQDGASQMRQVELTLVANGSMQDQGKEPVTRVTPITCTRYVVAAYLGEGYSTPANIFDDGQGEKTNRMVNSDGRFNLGLSKLATYSLVFWADNDPNSEIYNINSFPRIYVNSGKGGDLTEAFCGLHTVAAGGLESLSVTLNHALAKVTLRETKVTGAGTLNVKFTYADCYDITNGAAGGMDATFDKDFTIEADVSGTSKEPVVLIDKPIYFWTTANQSSDHELTFTYKDNVPFKVKAPFQGNHNTNISGGFASLNPRIVKINGVDFEFILVKKGTFMMGTDPTHDQLMQSLSSLHQVTLTKDFWMMRGELTQAQWKAVMGSDNNPSPDDQKAPGAPNGERLPVTNISWDDLMVGGTTNCPNQSFLQIINSMGHGTFALPTDAQFEYAMRGGHLPTTPAYMTFPGYQPEDIMDLGPIGKYIAFAWSVTPNGTSMTQEVDSHKSNILGLCHMGGNVMEIMKDYYYQDLGTDPVIDPVKDTPYLDEGGRATDNVVCRGTSAGDAEPYAGGCASRSWQTKKFDAMWSGVVGFRLVLEP